MKRNEILEKYSSEIKEIQSKKISISSTDIIYLPCFSKEEVENEFNAHNYWKNFFKLEFIPEHEKYEPRDTMLYKESCSLTGEFPYYILWLNPIKILETLEEEAYKINRYRYTNACYDLSEGYTYIPLIAFDGSFKLLDGRHRIIAFLVHCGYRTLPFCLLKEGIGANFEKEYKHLLEVPNDVNIFIKNNEYCIEIPTKF